ncbi:MAG TPA: hypothetical protein ENN25_07280 [Euryarchaeota archaeon]|nr:hypothetical protein [Euryarchaeota archaeon]
MTEELYDSRETQSALEALGVLADCLPNPFVVLGGWAVYLTVSESFRREHGAPYLGSRDIDIGFHIDQAMSVRELRNSTFSKAIEAVRIAGYTPIGSSRYCKFIERETGEILTEEEAKELQIHEVFYLYLDILVDKIHPRLHEVFDIKILDEPIIGRIFDGSNFVSVNAGGNEVMIPSPNLLLASKLASIPKRQRGDKILKDACDIYAVIWHSPKSYKAIMNAVLGEYPRECEDGLQVINDDIARAASHHLGVDLEQYLDVVNLLKE